MNKTDQLDALALYDAPDGYVRGNPKASSARLGKSLSLRG